MKIVRLDVDEDYEEDVDEDGESQSYDDDEDEDDEAENQKLKHRLAKAEAHLHAVEVHPNWLRLERMLECQSMNGCDKCQYIGEDCPPRLVSPDDDPLGIEEADEALRLLREIKAALKREEKKP